jgi:hypothetical protein
MEGCVLTCETVSHQFMKLVERSYDNFHITQHTQPQVPSLAGEPCENLTTKHI